MTKRDVCELFKFYKNRIEFWTTSRHHIFEVIAEIDFRCFHQNHVKKRCRFLRVWTFVPAISNTSSELHFNRSKWSDFRLAFSSKSSWCIMCRKRLNSFELLACAKQQLILLDRLFLTRRQHAPARVSVIAYPILLREKMRFRFPTL